MKDNFVFFEKKRNDEDIGPFCGAIEAPILDFLAFSLCRSSIACVSNRLYVCMMLPEKYSGL